MNQGKAGNLPAFVFCRKGARKLRTERLVNGTAVFVDGAYGELDRVIKDVYDDYGTLKESPKSMP